jgi:hypothetical protein
LNHLEEVLIITKKMEHEPAVSTAGAPLRAADILAQRLPTVPDTPPPSPRTAASSPPAGTEPASANGASATELKRRVDALGAAPAPASAGLSKPQPTGTLGQTGDAVKTATRPLQQGVQPSTGALQPKTPNSATPIKAPGVVTPSGITTPSTLAPKTKPTTAQPPVQSGTMSGTPRVKPPSTNSTALPGNPAASKPTTAPVQTKPVKPAGPATKPVANTTQAPPKSTPTTEAPQ